VVTLERTLAFIGFSIVLAITPGPSNTLLTATGARVGVIRGLPALAGVAVGMAVLMFVVAFGLGAIILENGVILTAVRWIGGAVLIWLAWKIATSSVSTAGKVDTGVRPIGFPGAAAFQWVNPKSWLACTGGAAGFLVQTGGSAALQAATLALIFMLVSLLCCFVWLAFGAVVQRLLRSERTQRAFNVVMGGVLAVSAVLFVV
jgi:threonine/homoserine/homoserine lactone efflux protein